MRWRHYLVVSVAYAMVPVAGFVGIERVHDWMRRLAIRVYGL